MNASTLPAPIPDRITRIMRSNHWQYWFLQTAGWTGYAAFIMAESWVVKTLDRPYVLFTLAATLLGLLLTMAMREYFRLVWRYPAHKRWLLVLLSLGMATGIWSTWKLHVSTSITAHMESKNLLYEQIYEQMYWYSYSFCILLSWTGLYYGIKYYRLVQEEHEKTLMAEAMAHQAQLKMLRYQLNPHFLFNTLNSISTLVLDRQGDLANRMIAELSRFLRYSLDNDPMQKVTLHRELEAMRLYLDIETIRFGERLRIDYRIEEPARDACIPSLLLQPLIENAIKHAIAASESGGLIRIAARVFAGDLLLEVSDDGPGMQDPDCRGTGANGVGLVNIRERLHALYGDNHACRFSNNDPHGLKVEIRIPFETGENPAAWKN